MQSDRAYHRNASKSSRLRQSLVRLSKPPCPSLHSLIPTPKIYHPQHQHVIWIFGGRRCTSRAAREDNLSKLSEGWYEYVEIAREVRSLHSVLRALRSEAQRPDSGIFSRDASGRRDLIETADGCKKVLDELASMLSKYEGLGPDGATGRSKRLWQRFRFGSKIEELAAIRGKLVIYTSTISVLLDTMQLKASDRIEQKVDGGFTEVLGNFASIRKEILTIAVHERARQKVGSTVSVLSLSTCIGDDRAVWREFRRELIRKGFRSSSLERYRDVLQDYMLRLHESGVLEDYLEEGSEEEQEIDEPTNLIENPHSDIRSFQNEKEKDSTDQQSRVSTDSAANLPQHCTGKPLWDGEEALYAKTAKWRDKLIVARYLLDNKEPLSFEEWLFSRRRSLKNRVSFSDILWPQAESRSRPSSSAPLRSILRKPTSQFPEDKDPLMEGFTFRKFSGPMGIPPDHRWTKLSKKTIAPEVVDIFRLRCQIKEDHIIILEYLDEETMNDLKDATSTARSIRAAGVSAVVSYLIKVVRHSGVRFQAYHLYDEYTAYRKVDPQEATSKKRQKKITSDFYDSIQEKYGGELLESIGQDVLCHANKLNRVLVQPSSLCSSNDCSCSAWKKIMGLLKAQDGDEGHEANVRQYSSLLGFITTPGNLGYQLSLAIFAGQILFSDGKILVNDVFRAHGIEP